MSSAEQSCWSLNPQFVKINTNFHEISARSIMNKLKGINLKRPKHCREGRNYHLTEIINNAAAEEMAT